MSRLMRKIAYVILYLTLDPAVHWKLEVEKQLTLLHQQIKIAYHLINYFNVFEHAGIKKIKHCVTYIFS